jgi:manganese/zinc/iron transport system permease protein
MLLGAAVVGVVTAALVESIHRAGRVESGASMGIVFTVLFAVGLILIREAADHVDLDPDCVLFGAIELTPLDEITLLGVKLPRAILSVGPALAINALFVLVFYKELKLASFDPALATALGISARAIHYLLMTLVAITTVAAFESVGSILVIAMLIVPPAAAHLLTDRLGVLIVLSLVIAAASAVLGHASALAIPAWLGLAGVSIQTAGMISVAAGLLFALALLAGPRYGLISRAWHRLALALGTAREDMLAALLRREEREPGSARLDARELVRLAAPFAPLVGRVALASLRMRMMVALAERGVGLTPAGRKHALELLRAHRLWETYLGENIATPPAHVHDSAERLEHVTDAALRDRLATTLGQPEHDPHGKPIPREAREPGA